VPKQRKPAKRQDWAKKFLERLARTGNVSAACKHAKVPRRTAYERRDREVDFAAVWDEAIEIAVEVLELEARRRAAEGTLRPVFQGGKKCGAIREFSDTLLIFLLKAHRPEKYRDNMTLRHEGGVQLEIVEEIVDAPPASEADHPPHGPASPGPA
jgi:hypothetical protein